MTQPVGGPRLYHIEWLRVFLTVIVVLHHAAQPNGPASNAWVLDNPLNRQILLPFISLNSAYFMGFFFLISGYFLEGSFERRGALRFVGGRLLRLGVPLVILVGLVFPLITAGLTWGSAGIVAALRFENFDVRTLNYGPLWFVANLLVYSLIYAALRISLPGLAPRPSRPSTPGNAAILGFALVLGPVSIALQNTAPGAVWVDFLWLVPVELNHIPQYVSLFVIGIVAARGRWLDHIDEQMATRWLALGMTVFCLSFALAAIQPSLPAALTPERCWALLEPFVCVGLILGLLALAQRHFNGPTRRTDWLAAQSYGVYLLHLPVVMVFQTLAQPVDAPAILRFAVVAIASVGTSFFLVAGLRRIRLVRRVIG